MIFYWYTPQYYKLQHWTKVLTAKVINHYDQRISIKIGPAGHDISSEHRFTEILSQTLPIKLIPKSLEFDSSKEDSISKNDLNLKISSEKYQLTTVDKFLDTPDCVFYNFIESDDWIIVKWETDKNIIKFRTLRTMKQENTILLTSSVYSS
ncbi:MAG: hypothetical protein AAGF07_02105 [Patescibacteria group bacterium]